MLVLDATSQLPIELRNSVASLVSHIDAAEPVRDFKGRRVSQVVEGPLESTCPQILVVCSILSALELQEVHLDVSPADRAA